MVSSIKYIDPYNKEKSLYESKEGLKNESREIIFPWVAGAYRCTPDSNYADSFGFQWNLFEKTQIDAYSKTGQSSLRFSAVTGWDKQGTEKENILEVGSGAGRFTEVILKQTGANLYSVDYSNAVEANYRNNGNNERLKLFQASIYEMPFAPAQFDRVLCFGVLQHTSDFKKSVKSLVEMVKPGGELIVDFYPIDGWYTKIHAKYILRPLAKRVSNQRLLSIIQKNAGWMIGLSKFFTKIGLGKLLNRFLPICDIETTIPKSLEKDRLKEWVILDTFDMFSPEFDNPQKIETVKGWFEEFGMDVKFAGYIKYDRKGSVAVVKGIKK